MAYVPNPDDVTQPTDAVIAETAQAEFRALKSRIAYMSGLFQSWNPGDATAEARFLNGYLGFTTSETTGTNVAAARAVIGAFNAKRVWEITVTAGGSGVIALGVMRQSEPLAQQLGTQDFAYAVLNNGDVWVEGTMTGNVSGASYTTGDILGFELDTTGGATFKFLKNGVQQVSTPIDLTGPPAAYFPAVSISPGTSSILANFGTSPFIYVYDGGYSLFSQNIVFPPGLINYMINSSMRIDQEYGASPVTPATGDYIIDGWKYFATQANNYEFHQSDPYDIAMPPGYSQFERAQVLIPVAVGASDTFGIQQGIPGQDAIPLGFGQDAVQQVTLLLTVMSNVVGMHSGSIQNGVADRSFPFSFRIYEADTWTACAVVFYADQTGAWASNSLAGPVVNINLGSGADFLGTEGVWQAGNKVGVTGALSLIDTVDNYLHLTGVELRFGAWPAGAPCESLSRAEDLNRCRRFYNKQDLVVGQGVSITGYSFPVSMRTDPTITGGGAGFAVVNVTQDSLYMGQTASALETIVMDARY